MPYLYRLHKNGEVEEIVVSEVKNRKDREWWYRYYKQTEYYGKTKDGKRLYYTVRNFQTYVEYAKTVFMVDRDPDRAMKYFYRKFGVATKGTYGDYMERMKRLCRMI